MNNKTVITQNTPHKVSVAEGSSHAARPIIDRGQGGGPSVIETPITEQATPILQDALRRAHAYKEEGPQKVSQNHSSLRSESPHPEPKAAAAQDTEHALLDDWSLSPELIERIDDLRLQNAQVQSAIDRLSTPSPVKARV